jgi:hypothetical protein
LNGNLQKAKNTKRISIFLKFRNFPETGFFRMTTVSFPSLSIQARSLDIPTNAHPNRMPFSGVLTRIDEPSDAAPEGSGGKRIMLTMAAAQGALDSLLGQGVNYCLSGHAPQEKIGVISASEIVGNELRINGFIYAADFPIVAATIKENKHKLGLSFEARDLMTTDPDADPIPIAECIFTGAAILLKDKAAYRTTFIHANKDSEMSIIDKMSATERAKLADSLEASAPHMSKDELQNLIATLTGALHGDTIKAKAAGDHRTTVLVKISAARSEGRGTMDIVDGALRRAALPAFEEIALKAEGEIKSILASAKMKLSDYDHIVLRSVLARVGATGR